MEEGKTMHGSAKRSIQIAEEEDAEIIDLDIKINKKGPGPYVFYQTAYLEPKLPYDGRHITTWLTGLPWGTKAVSVWATENFGAVADGSEPHAGHAKFFTHSVQLAGGGSICRVIWSVDWPKADKMTIPGSLILMGVVEDV
jgi:hypothetical protein